jgi:hypothetical protein
LPWARATRSLEEPYLRLGRRSLGYAFQVQLVSLRITPGNIADVTQAEALLSGLRGLVVADAAYISVPLREKLWELGLLLLTPLRKNRKGLTSREQT